MVVTGPAFHPSQLIIVKPLAAVAPDVVVVTGCGGTTHAEPSYTSRRFTSRSHVAMPSAGACEPTRVAPRSEADAKRITPRGARALAMSLASLLASGASVSAAMLTPCP
jgi:hypothetical protein